MAGLQCCLFPGTDPEDKLSGTPLMWSCAACDLLATKTRMNPPDVHALGFPVPWHDLFWTYGFLLRQADMQAYLRFLRCVTSGFMQSIGLGKNNKGTVTHFPAFNFLLISNLSWFWVCSSFAWLLYRPFMHCVKPLQEGLQAIAVCTGLL